MGGLVGFLLALSLQLHLEFADFLLRFLLKELGILQLLLDFQLAGFDFLNLLLYFIGFRFQLHGALGSLVPALLGLYHIKPRRVLLDKLPLQSRLILLQRKTKLVSL